MTSAARNRARGSTAVLAAALAAATLAGVAPAEAADRLFGLVVGIDDYLGTVNDLQGAVNDATGIADALKKAGADDVRFLTDGAATKAAIEKNWNDLVAEAGPGDTIVFSYAGHGGQEPQPPGLGRAQRPQRQLPPRRLRGLRAGLEGAYRRLGDVSVAEGGRQQGHRGRLRRQFLPFRHDVSERRLQGRALPHRQVRGSEPRRRPVEAARPLGQAGDGAGLQEPHLHRRHPGQHADARAHHRRQAARGAELGLRQGLRRRRHAMATII